jgi:putative colanic acid biosynthesis glycosyltransferase
MNVSFSIITVTYQNLDGLRHTYESIKNQDYKYFDWIIIDGLSTDGTVAYIKNHENDIKNLQWISEKDKGIYHAMNKGIERVTGDYTIFLNAGDRFFNNDVLGETAQVIESLLANAGDKLPPIFYGDYVMNFASGLSLLRKSRPERYISHSLPTSHQAIFYPKAFLKSNQYDLIYKICCDYYLTCVAYADGYKLVPIPVTISVFEIGGTSSQQFIKAIRETYNIQRRVLKSNLLKSQISAIHRLASFLTVKTLNKFNAKFKRV